IAAPDPDFVGYEPGPQYIRDDRAKVLREEHAKLAAYVAVLEAKGHKAEALLVQGPTIETLIAEADKLKADVIVMGHHKHGWLYKFFNEETATETISKALVPVLIIPL
ncbi:MAG: universal stress protein, partial [Mucilaginibacter sp.]